MDSNRQSIWFISRVACGLAVLTLTLLSVVGISAQTRGQVAEQDENYAIFVSQRNGAAELYLIDLTTKKVSQITNSGRGHLSPSIALDSRTILFAERSGSNYELYSGQINAAWRNRRPTVVGVNRITTGTEDKYSPSISIDGGMISFASGNGIELMTYNGAGRRVLVPVNESTNSFNPVISPDGKRVAFASDRSGSYEIWIYTRSTGDLRQLTNGANVLGGLNWSIDSRQLAFASGSTSNGRSGIALANSESGSFRVLTEDNDSSPSLSARGDRLIFTSTRDGDPELYLLNIGSGRIERLTNSMGVDDTAVFLSEPVRPYRSIP